MEDDGDDDDTGSKRRGTRGTISTNRRMERTTSFKSSQVRIGIRKIAIRQNQEPLCWIQIAFKPNNKQCSGWIVSDTLPFDKDSWSFGVKNKVGSGSERIVVLFLRGWRRVLRRQAVNIKETK